MYTLEAATRRAQLEAAESGEPVYVIEMVNEREPEDPALAGYVPDPAEVLRIVQEDAEAERAYRENPAAARAAGILPPWSDWQPTAEERLIEADYTDEADPITFSTMSGLSAAIHLLRNFDVDILRVAHPDGTLVAVADKTDEWAKVHLRYGSQAFPLAARMTAEQ